MPSMGYTSVAEKLSERFHMTVTLLQKFNPGSDFVPGKKVHVVDSARRGPERSSGSR
jgi:LysM repeat protein